MQPKRHPNATTTPDLRKLIQDSPESGRALAARIGRDRKTVSKWRNRTTTQDQPSGPKSALLSSLDAAEEEFVVHYRMLTRFTLDACLDGLRDVFPALSRSALHRLLKRRGVGRLRRGLTTNFFKEAERYIAGHFWIAAYRNGLSRAAANQNRAGKSIQGSTSDALFTAIEMKSGRVFCQRLPPTRRSAAHFLGQLAQETVIKVAVTAKDDLLFVANNSELLPSEEKNAVDWHPFAQACRKKRISHWTELTAPDILAAALKPKRRRRKRRRKKSPSR